MNYLYNGVELPDINTVWTDRETYRYAVVTTCIGCTGQLTTEHYDLELYSVMKYKKTSSGYIVGFQGRVKRYYLPDGYSYWRFNSEGTLESDLGTAFQGKVDSKSIIWTSAHIMYKDGKEYLIATPATKPVPVGGEPINPTEMLMGYTVGQAIRK